MKITYLSHSCFLLETENHTLIIDPFLTGNPLATVKPESIKCDYVIVTHGHNDHMGDALEIAKANDATLISNFEIAMYFQSQGLEKIHPMHIGGAFSFPFGRVKLTLAHHGSGYQTENGFLYMGNPAGVLITTKKEKKTVYHAGDTALFLDMKLIGEMDKIDVALLPIGDNFTMGPEDAAKAAFFLKPKIVVPMHYNTFDLIQVDPHVFEQKATTEETEVQVLKVDETLEI